MAGSRSEVQFGTATNSYTTHIFHICAIAEYAFTSKSIAPIGG